MKIALKQIKPSPFQVRARINGQPLAELQESMAQVGQAVPIKVRSIASKKGMPGHYEIVYGHRRLEAARLLKWQEIEALVEDLTDEQAMIQGLAENVQRDDLEPLDEARAYKRLMDDFGWKQERIAAEVGRGHQYVSRLLALLIESPAVQKLIGRAGDGGLRPGRKVTERHVRAAREAGLGTPDREAVIHKAADEGLSSKQTRQVAEAIKVAPNPQAREKLLEHEYDSFVHDADRIREQARRTPGRDPVVQTRQRKADADWRETPEVAEMLRRLAQIENEWAPAFLKLIRAGKLDPAGHAFVISRINRAIGALQAVTDELEEKA